MCKQVVQARKHEDGQENRLKIKKIICTQTASKIRGLWMTWA